jgi:hypothetical protein
VLRRPIISDTARMIAKCFLKHGLPLWYDLISGNPKRVNIMKIKAADKRFGLSIKPKKDDNKKLLGFSEKEGWPEWKEENQKKRAL